MQKLIGQLLDVDYMMVNNKPLLRIFCKQKDGKTICLLYNKYLPYFYLVSPEENYEDIKKNILKVYPNLKFEILEKFLPIGYNKKVKALKIIGNDPSKIPEIRGLAEKFGTCYEADILFKYRFMADMQLRGMEWIEADGKPAKTNTVNCDCFEINSIKKIDIQENAPLKYLSLDIECITDATDRMPDPSKDPIIIISLCFYPEYKNKKQIILISKRSGIKNENIIENDSEEKMLEEFINIIKDYDPDIIIGYNINNFDMPYLIQRMETLNIPRMLGRANKAAFLKKLQQGYSTSIIGRVIVDPYEIIRRDPWLKFKRYDLNTVAKEMLNDTKIDIGGIREIKHLWENDINKLLEYAGKDAELALKLIIQKGLLDKFFELSKISGLLLQDIFGGQSQRHEFNILSEFVKENILMPCKPTLKRKSLSEDELKGAIVFEPEIGLHNNGNILVLDFTSLYPSLIRTYNICPTTLLLTDENVPFYESPIGVKFVKETVKEGVLPRILKKLMESRKAVRQQMKNTTDPELLRILDAKQLALKDMANSLYGYTGYSRSRLFVMSIANSITAYGRENIKFSKELVEKNFPVKVIYGDTDSIFVKTNITDLEASNELGNKISEFVSESLPGVLELKFEKIFKSFLILSKKRYAGWSFEKDGDKWKEKIVMKGIETVRRDWCELVGKTMKNILKIILKDGDIKKAAKIFRDVAKDLAEGKIPLEDLVVIKSITKSLDSYDGVQPHVELAKKMLERNPALENIVGERIGYVIIKGTALLSKRAEDPKYVKEHGLEIDSNYYIQNQLLPPIERIFEVCGVTTTELLEGSKQKSLIELIKKSSSKSESKNIEFLENFDSVVCRGCGWSHHRPTLNGKCYLCGGQLAFSFNGNISDKIKILEN